MGAQIRAAVDNRRMAESLGINIERLFTITFAFGSGMAALGGGLGAEFLGLDPQYALKYLVFFLIVVAVGGPGKIFGVFYASLIIGDPRFRAEEIRPAGRHAVHLCADHPPAAVAAAGPVRKARSVSAVDTHAAGAEQSLVTRHRLRWWEPIPWLLLDRLLFSVSAPSRLRQRIADHHPVRALARSGARLCRHRHARTRGVFRRRRLYRRHAGQARHLERADYEPDPCRRDRGPGRTRLRLCGVAHHRADAVDADAVHHGVARGSRQSRA